MYCPMLTLRPDGRIEDRGSSRTGMLGRALALVSLLTLLIYTEPITMTTLHSFVTNATMQAFLAGADAVQTPDVARYLEESADARKASVVDTLSFIKLSILRDAANTDEAASVAVYTWADRLGWTLESDANGKLYKSKAAWCRGVYGIAADDTVTLDHLRKSLDRLIERGRLLVKGKANGTVGKSDKSDVTKLREYIKRNVGRLVGPKVDVDKVASVMADIHRILNDAVTVLLAAEMRVAGARAEAPKPEPTVEPTGTEPTGTVQPTEPELVNAAPENKAESKTKRTRKSKTDAAQLPAAA